MWQKNGFYTESNEELKYISVMSFSLSSLYLFKSPNTSYPNWINQLNSKKGDLTVWNLKALHYWNQITQHKPLWSQNLTFELLFPPVPSSCTLSILVTCKYTLFPQACHSLLAALSVLFLPLLILQAILSIQQAPFTKWTSNMPFLQTHYYYYYYYQ